MGIRKLDEVNMRYAGEVGGKAASLGEMLQAGQRAPQGFVITADEQAMTPALQKDILQLFDDLQLDLVAVRSSGTREDGHSKSWAGQFTTFLNVNRGGLIAAIKTCWDSAKSARAEAYGRPANLAVLVQQMIQSDTAGVAFSINPVTGNQNQVVIEAVYGLCEPLVGGTATPDHYVVDKSSGGLVEQDIAEKTTRLALYHGKNKTLDVAAELQNEPALNDAQLRELSALARAIEHHYHFPVDIEWTFQDNRLYLLQARPITTV